MEHEQLEQVWLFLKKRGYFMEYEYMRPDDWTVFRPNGTAVPCYNETRQDAIKLAIQEHALEGEPLPYFNL